MKKEFVKPAVEVVEIDTVICADSMCPGNAGGGTGCDITED